MKVKITGFGSYGHDWVAETKDLKITKERDVVTIDGKYGKTVKLGGVRAILYRHIPGNKKSN